MIQSRLKQLVFFSIGLVAALTCGLQPMLAQAQSSKEATAAINDLLETYRKAAAEADAEAFFGCLDKDGFFFGTDEKERFSYEQFKAFILPYFKKGDGWNRTVIKRQIHLGPDFNFAWFEEKSTRPNLGTFRATGVVIKKAGQWKITQSHTSFPIPNELFEKVSEQIKKFNESSTAARDEAPLNAQQRKKAEESFDYIWKKVKDTYWDKNMGGVDWQAAYDELRPQLDNAKTMSEARSVMSMLIQRMKVSHFGIIPASAYQELGTENERKLRDGFAGLVVRIVNDQVIVVEVTPGSPAANANIKTGWIVKTINEIDVPSRLAKIKKEFESNPRARTILSSAANSRFYGRLGDEIKITFLDENDQAQQTTFNLGPLRGEKVQFGHIPEFHVWVDVKTIDKDIGYFRFNAFMNPVQVMSAYNKFITDNLDSPGIIIDVRGNGGGSGEIGMGMIGWLMPGKKTTLGKVVLRNNELKLIARPRPTTYHGAVVLLIDEMSGSAAELFARGMKDLTNARLIGSRTAGAVLGSQIERLPNGDGFQYAAVNFISDVTGKTLEGIGVSPHQEVQPDRKTLLAGKDPAIEAAVKWIRQQSK